MKYQELISKMTLEEKVSLLSGKDMWETKKVERLGIPSVILSDGPHGVRRQLGAGDHLGLNESMKATCFPTAATIANSWDTDLGEEIGKMLGEEAGAQKVGVLLGPGLNIKRSPLCGRNFEYFSEDPHLSGKMAAAYIRGIQSQGVAACPKHFAVNNQELGRMVSNSVLDERTMREIYLTAFEIAVEESSPKTIMSSYNQVNGTYTSENKMLLRDILVDEWGFDGFVVTDWGGSNCHVQGVKNGNHLEMPGTGGDGDYELLKAIKSGTLSEELLDQRVDEFLNIIFEISEKKNENSKSFDVEYHHQIARKASEGSIILLKNEEDILPLNLKKTVAVIGDFAETPRYQGAGSSMVNCTKLDSFLESVKQSEISFAGFEKGYRRNRKPDKKLLEDAVELAKKADVVLYCMGLDEISETEGLDRMNMKVAENQIQLLSALRQVNKNIIVILSAGACVEMPWEKDCKGIIHGYLAGQAGAGALVKIITGKVCPSGKLAETYPLVYEDTPAYYYFPGREYSAEYREGLYVGYRYYDTVGKEVRYPFGFGLSYTKFQYSNLAVNEKEVKFSLKNIGKMDGAEVVQFYVKKKECGVYRPIRELKGFQKIWLKQGEEKTICIPFDEKTFRYYDGETGQWEVESGSYEIQIGASSRDIRLSEDLFINGTKECKADKRGSLPHYESGQIRQVTDDEFQRLLGFEIPISNWDKSKKLGMNDALCQMYYAKSVMARLVYKILTRIKNKSEKKGVPNLNVLFIYHMPFRGLAKMTNGMITMNMVTDILEMVNGHFFKGAGRLIKALWNNRKKKQL